jgi:hypothetical protein
MIRLMKGFSGFFRNQGNPFIGQIKVQTIENDNRSLTGTHKPAADCQPQYQTPKVA